MSTRTPSGVSLPAAANKFMIIKKCGAGGFSSVYKATDLKGKQKVALKVVHKAKRKRGELDILRNEVELLRNYQHVNIVQLFDVFEDDENIVVVLEFCKGGDLFDEISKRGVYGEADARVLISSLCKAVAFLHKNNIAHRDIKVENVLLRSRSSEKHRPLDICLADFGLAVKVDNVERLPPKAAGSVLYSPPELLDTKVETKKLVFELGLARTLLAGDSWQIGCATWVVLLGFMPFNAPEDICENEIAYEEDDWKNISLSGGDFVRHLLIRNPSKRMDVQNALKSEWLAPSLGTHVRETLHVRTDSLQNVSASPEDEDALAAGIHFVKSPRDPFRTDLISSSKQRDSKSPSPTAVGMMSMLDMDDEEHEEEQENGKENSVSVSSSSSSSSSPSFQTPPTLPNTPLPDLPPTPRGEELSPVPLYARFASRFNKKMLRRQSGAYAQNYET